MKYIKYIFIVFTIISVTYVAAGQIFLPDDKITDEAEDYSTMENYLKKFRKLIFAMHIFTITLRKNYLME